MPQKNEITRIDVAVGILISPTGQFLLTSRPVGKPMEGYWEFPGGKIEQGETVEEALRRELMEELGVEIGRAHLWKETQHDYPHALVRLHWCKVYEWHGALLMRERQSYAWQKFPLNVTPILPGAYPVLEWLESEGVGRTPSN
ncbi:MAG: NUDIX domain-containing protein [Saezia sp.]